MRVTFVVVCHVDSVLNTIKDVLTRILDFMVKRDTFLDIGRNEKVLDLFGPRLLFISSGSNVFYGGDTHWLVLRVTTWIRDGYSIRIDDGT